jgi:hypothetical protein
MHPTTLVLTFSTALDPVRAQNLANYQLVMMGRAGGTIAITSAVYNASTHSVTLSPAQLLSLHQAYQLTVIGTGSSGITDTSGNLLDGQRTGKPGSNFVTTITAANLVLTTPALRRPLAFAKIASWAAADRALAHRFFAHASRSRRR